MLGIFVLLCIVNLGRDRVASDVFATVQGQDAATEDDVIIPEDTGATETDDGTATTDSTATEESSTAPAAKSYNWKGESYEEYKFQNRANGYVVQYWSEGQECWSFILIPGMQIGYSHNFLGFLYLIMLIYLFLGIAIIADIFMEAIEVITSKTKTIEVHDNERKQKYYIDVPVWNATIANLTLMALGSSAPEILLAVIETTSTLGEEAGELGPSTIVGSAAFNLLVISALSIIAVDKPKKIFSLAVFFTTSVFSVFAYVWLFICLQINSPNEVTVGEAWLTLCFFIILVALAFIADKMNQCSVDAAQSEEDHKKRVKEEDLKIKKNLLRHFAKLKGEMVVVEVAQGI